MLKFIILALGLMATVVVAYPGYLGLGGIGGGGLSYAALPVGRVSYAALPVANIGIASPAISYGGLGLGLGGKLGGLGWGK